MVAFYLQIGACTCCKNSLKNRYRKLLKKPAQKRALPKRAKATLSAKCAAMPSPQPATLSLSAASTSIPVPTPRASPLISGAFPQRPGASTTVILPSILPGLPVIPGIIPFVPIVFHIWAGSFKVTTICFSALSATTCTRKNHRVHRLSLPCCLISKSI